MKFKESIHINASQESVFDFTHDYSNRLLWDTFLRKADLMEDAMEAGFGVKAYCEAKNGMGMITEYVSFSRPKATAIKMIKGPYLFDSFLGSWNFKPIGHQKTEVIFLYSFTLRFPFNLLGIFIKNNLRNNVQQRLLDLKNSLESNR
jgi:ribosome-associated toxin RatA of RatAB toxin-antitoxin module